MASLFDMPLEQLKTYNGTNPRPDDFDDFWDIGLKEISRIDPQIEIIESDFRVPFAKCSDMYFTGVGNARIHAKLIQPSKKENQGPAICHFHGYAGNSGDWFDKLPYAALGFTVAAMDCRGQGGISEDSGGVAGNTLNGHIIRGLSENSPEKLLYRQIFLDTAQLAGIVMKLPGVDPTRVGATGWSQGGGLTLACAALEPRIKKAAPVYPFLTDYRRVWDIDLAKDAYNELKEFFRKFDPQHRREQEIFTRLGYIDVQYLCPRIKAETLMITGLSDTICPPSTQFAAYNKISSKKKMEIYPDFAHEALPEAMDKIYRFLAEL
jgi:cephalosporin-C deacetylase